MALPNPKKPSLNQVLKLVAQLSPEEHDKVRLKLDQTRYQEWRELVNTIAEDNKNIPVISDSEIMAEIKAVRQSKKGKRCLK
jgi:hypothetical protein